MAIDLTGQAPQYATNASVTNATATQIRVPPFHAVKILASDAMKIFAATADGGAVPGAADVIIYTQTEMAAGIVEVAGGAYPGSDPPYAVISIAGSTGAVAVRASTIPPEKVAP